MSEALDNALGRIDGQVKKFLLQSGEQWRAAMTRRFGPGRPMQSGSGQLAGSLNYSVSGSRIADFELRCFTAGVPYARIKEFGGVIRPKRAKMLAIPGKDNRTAAGLARYPSARDFIGSHKHQISIVPSALHPGTFVVLWYPALGILDKKQRSKALRGWRAEGSKRGLVMFIFARKSTQKGPKTDGSDSKLSFFQTWKDLDGARTTLMSKLLGARALFSKGGA